MRKTIIESNCRIRANILVFRKIQKINNIIINSNIIEILLWEEGKSKNKIFNRIIVILSSRRVSIVIEERNCRLRIVD